MGQSGLDPKEFLEALREEHRLLRWEPLAPSQPRSSSGGEQSRSGTSLDYLHQHWTLPDTFHSEDAGVGPRSRMVALFGKLTFRVLGRYLREEREVLGHVVRISEALERRCDALTLRIRELDEEIRLRQVAESENQARLAAWLYSELPSEAGAAGAISQSSALGTLAASSAMAAETHEDGNGSR
ncbi:MAG: hypothetical protein ACYCV7_12890 [Acidimicrobiales bacterium]